MEVEVNTQVHKHVHTLGGLGWALLVAMLLLCSLTVWSLIRQQTLNDLFLTKTQETKSVLEAQGKKIEGDLRANTVAEDLAKYNAEENRVHAEVNQVLMGIILGREKCLMGPGR